jgi:hypothetical protein
MKTNTEEKEICTDVIKSRLLKSSNLPPEPVFVNVYGAQESIPMDRFRQPI